MIDPDVKISGDAEGGFIVEMHDGDRFLVVPMMAEHEDAARAEGLRRFHESAPVVDVEADQRVDVDAAAETGSGADVSRREDTEDT